MTRDELHRALLLAHSEHNYDALVDLYQQAAAMDQHNDPKQSFFFLTHAYVFALDTNHEAADSIAEQLRAGGRL